MLTRAFFSGLTELLPALTGGYFSNGVSGGDDGGRESSINSANSSNSLFELILKYKRDNAAEMAMAPLHSNLVKKEEPDFFGDEEEDDDDEAEEPMPDCHTDEIDQVDGYIFQLLLNIIAIELHADSLTL